MHPTELPQWAKDRVFERRGTHHIHSGFDPAKTALIVIDLQNSFMDQNINVLSHIPCAVEIVPNVNRLAAALRDAGGMVYWIKGVTDDEVRKNWTVWLDMMKPEKRAKTAALGPDSFESQLHSSLDIREEDEIVVKRRFSAFLENSSDLHARLQARGIDTVIITGTLTNICCESSARDAMMMNYKMIMVSDGTATHTDQEHIASLTVMYTNFGDVMETDMLIGEINREQKAA
jgi:ureidoacrylate peracid hydrolase